MNQVLKEKRLVDSYTQSKNELCLKFGSDFNMRVQLGPYFPCFNFPGNLHRAKRNTTDIFPGLIGQPVEKVEAVKYDRSILIHFEKDKLLFKMHGNRGNVIRIIDNQSNELFNQSFKNDLNLDLLSLGKDLPTFKEFEEEEGNIKKLFPVLGNKLLKKLLEKGYEQHDIEEKFELFISFIEELESKSSIFINDEGEYIELSLYRVGERSEEFSDPIEGMHEFFLRKMNFDRFNHLQSRLIREKEKQLTKLKNYILNLEHKESVLQEDDRNKYYADVIMSQIHSLGEGVHRKVQLLGFQGERITLDFKGKPAAAVAENYYRKSKNKQIEINTIAKNIRLKKREAANLEKEISEIKSAISLKELNRFVKDKKGDVPVDSPFIQFEKDGFKILVGKNAKNNDRLTLRHSFKEDLWLHAKDVPGSHVLIKYKSGMNFPSPVINYAASIAAFYSKRKTESLVPVIVTPRKYVRKRKGDPPGAVVVEREKVILVEPNRELR